LFDIQFLREKIIDVVIKSSNDNSLKIRKILCKNYSNIDRNVDSAIKAYKYKGIILIVEWI